MKDDERTYLIELATRAGFEPDSIETMTSMGDAHGVLPVIALILLHLDGDARRDDLERYKEWSKRYLLTALAIEVRKSDSGGDRGGQFQNDIFNIGASVNANHQGENEEALLRGYIHRLQDVEESNPIVALAKERLTELTRSDHAHHTTPQKPTGDDVDGMLTCEDVDGMLMGDIFNVDITSFKGQDMSHRLHGKLKRVLQCFFGYDQICLLYYLTLEENLQCGSPEECFRAIATTEDKGFVAIYTQSIEKLAKAIFVRKEDFITVLCRDFLLDSNLKNEHPLLEANEQYDEGSFWNTSTAKDIRAVFYDLTAAQVHRYFAEGLRVYLEKESAENNQCDISAASSDYRKDFKHTVKGKEVTYTNGKTAVVKAGKSFTKEELEGIKSIKKVYQSKQPSKINIWNDPVTLCPPNYVPETKTVTNGFLWAGTKKNTCCVPASSFEEYEKGTGDLTKQKLIRALRSYRHKRNVIKRGFEKKESWERAVEFIGGTEEFRNTRMHDIELDLARRWREATQKEEKEKYEQLRNEFLQLHSSTVREEWQKAELELNAYRTSLIGKQYGFVERVYQEIIYMIEINIKKYCLSTNNLKYEDWASKSTAVYIFQTTKDYFVHALILVLKHPRFGLFVTEILKRWKAQVCDAIAIEQGKFKLKSQMDEVKETYSMISDASYLITISALMDPASSHRVAGMIVDTFTSVAALTGFSFAGTFGTQIPVLFGTMAKPVIGEAIQTLTTGLVHYEGYRRLMELLDFASCGNEIALVSDRIRLNPKTPAVQTALDLFRRPDIQRTLKKLKIQVKPYGADAYTLPLDGTESYVSAAFAVLMHITGTTTNATNASYDAGTIRAAIPLVVEHTCPTSSQEMLVNVTKSTVASISNSTGDVRSFVEDMMMKGGNEHTNMHGGQTLFATHHVVPLRVSELHAPAIELKNGDELFRNLNSSSR